MVEKAKLYCFVDETGQDAKAGFLRDVSEKQAYTKKLAGDFVKKMIVREL